MFTKEKAIRLRLDSVYFKQNSHVDNALLIAPFEETEIRVV